MKHIEHDYYAILGVPKSASTDDIKHAYRQLARRHHPDRAGASGQITLINEAYATLKDPRRRAEYDAWHTLHFGVVGILTKKVSSRLQDIDFIDKNIKSFDRHRRLFVQFAKNHLDKNSTTWLKNAQFMLQKMQKLNKSQRTNMTTLTISQEVAAAGGTIHFWHEGRRVRTVLPQNLKDGAAIKLNVDGKPLWLMIQIQKA
ncbi:DnaJ domain-containing protein [Moraxella nasibovis]|uniref:DnaJ domain-containing protein n=1 Tax=Moraxella nasibovis TaxID=2904120 RepID=UPI00240FB817|nr:DnaJ domain-containing protein [Moraxella nasibovis]WFF38701.1 DnaJ domain-containing protein [Moraxella nasibovis]